MDLILPSRFGQEILSMLLKIAKFPNEEYIMHNFRLDFSDDSQHFRCINMHYESSFTKKFKVGKKQLVDFYAQPSVAWYVLVPRLLKTIDSGKRFMT